MTPARNLRRRADLVSKPSKKKISKRSSRRRIPTIRIGTSGWSYAHWRRVFYPESMASKRWLSYYVRYFDTVEVNNSFYHLPGQSAFEKWRAEAPSGFVFAVKANRFITHMKKLKNVDDALSLFVERAGILGRNLGPILFQLPPNLRFDAARLKDFLDQLPQRRRFVVEFRNATWINEKMVDMLKSKKVALCIHDLLDIDCPRLMTSSFSYFRFHGFSEKYGGSYPKRVLTDYAETMVEMISRGRDVYAYFNNDAFGYALKDAVRLRKLVSKMLTG
jgi:uncharacterized protein YecE (DUF72 family)